MFNQQLLIEGNSDRKKFANTFSYQMPQLAGHWTICLYFHYIFGDNTVIPKDHWIDEIAKFTANISKVQIKDKNTPQNRSSILYQIINDESGHKVISNSIALSHLRRKFNTEVGNSPYPVIASLKFDETIAQVCANYFMSCLTTDIVEWISNSMNKDELKGKYQEQFDNIFAKIDAKRQNQNNINEEYNQELNKIKFLFEFKSDFV